MSYTVPYSFVPGTKARAQEVNANFASILDSFDDLDSRKMNLDLSNITSAGIDVIKNNSSIRNLGELVLSTVPLSNAGLHLLDGALLQSGGIYNDFVKYIKNLYNSGNASSCFTTESNWQSSVTNYGECGKFVYNSTNNTVRLPKISGMLQYTINTSDVGNLTQAGLPNITGTYSDSSGKIGNLSSRSGAITLSTATTTNFGDGANSSSHVTAINFDASKSSAIYGRSSTVQPQTVKYLIYIVVGTVEKTDIQVDIDNVSTDLNGKADVDGSNMVASVKNFCGHWVASYSAIASSVSLPTTTDLSYSLTSYLPTDSSTYDYEVYVSGDFNTGTTSGNQAILNVQGMFATNVARAQTRTTSSVSGAGTAIVPISHSNRNIKVLANSSNSGKFNLYLRGYRRIGTNS